MRDGELLLFFPIESIAEQQTVEQDRARGLKYYFFRIIPRGTFWEDHR